MYMFYIHQMQVSCKQISATLVFMNSLFITLLFTSVVIMLASLSGVLFTWKYFDRLLRPRLSYLIALAMGVFIMIVYGLVEETLHEGITITSVAMFLFGAILLEVATMFLPKNTHHHHGTCNEHPTTIDARRVLIGDAVHNVHDGLVLVPAFLVSPVVGFGTALGVFLHEIVQEIAEFFILREAGYSIKKALTLNFIVSGTILFGVGLSYWFTEALHIGELLIPLSAGGFTYIILRDIGPSVYGYAKKQKAYLQYTAMVMFGIALMFTLQILIPHEHHEHHDEYPLPEGFELAVTKVSPVQG
jgi:zinc transporter ZupT